MYVVQLLRHGVDLQFQLSCGLINQVNGFVGKETVADITLRQLHSGDDSLVHDFHLMVVLITFLQATKDGDSAVFVWFFDFYGLETTFQSLIFLEVLLILIQGRGTDGAQFATRQSGFQDVGSIHGAFARSARTHEGVDFIDEEDDFAV